MIGTMIAAGVAPSGMPCRWTLHRPRHESLTSIEWGGKVRHRSFVLIGRRRSPFASLGPCDITGKTSQAGKWSELQTKKQPVLIGGPPISRESQINEAPVIVIGSCTVSQE